MSSQTPNLNLVLPVGTEKVSRQIINDNNTKIDTAVGANSTAIAKVANLPTGVSVLSLAELQTHILAVHNSVETERNRTDYIITGFSGSGFTSNRRYAGFYSKINANQGTAIYSSRYGDVVIVGLSNADTTPEWAIYGLATKSVESVQNVPFSTGVYYCSNSQTFGSVTIPSYCIYDLHVLGANGVGYATRVTNGAFYVLYGSNSAWNAISK